MKEKHVLFRLLFGMGIRNRIALFWFEKFIKPKVVQVLTCGNLSEFEYEELALLRNVVGDLRGVLTGGCWHCGRGGKKGVILYLEEMKDKYICVDCMDKFIKICREKLGIKSFLALRFFIEAKKELLRRKRQMSKQISIWNISEDELDNKTIEHAFVIYNNIYIGFTDNTWIGISVTEDLECGKPELIDATGIELLADLLEDFQWDIVKEFEKAGIIVDGKEIREELRKRRIRSLKSRLEGTTKIFNYINKELNKLETIN